MTQSFSLPLTGDELLVVVSDVWDATFGGLVSVVDDEPDQADRWWAVVELSDDGGPVAEVVTLFDGRSVRTATGIIFDTGQPDDRIQADAVGEAANIIAGNIKGILQLDTVLSAPRSGRGVATVTAGLPAVSLRISDQLGRRATVTVIDHLAGRRPVPHLFQEPRPC